MCIICNMKGWVSDVKIIMANQDKLENKLENKLDFVKNQIGI